MGSQSRRLDFLGREVFDEIVRHCKSATPKSSSMRKACERGTKNMYQEFTEVEGSA